MGPNKFGIFTVALSICLTLGVISGFGMSTRALRVGAESAPQEVTFTSAILRIASSLVILISGLIASTMLNNTTALLLAVILAVSDQLFDYAVSYYSGTESHSVASALLVLQRVLPLVLFTANLLYLSLPTVLVLVPGLVSSFGTCVFIGYGARSGGFRFRQIRSSFTYWFSTMGSNLKQLEPISLATIASTQALAAYAVGARISQPLTIFISALQVIYVPRLSATHGTVAFFSTLRRLRLAATVYGSTLVLLSPMIVAISLKLVGAAYQGFELLFYAVVAGAALSSYSQTFQMEALAEGRPLLPTLIIALGTLSGLAFLIMVLLLFGEQFIWLGPLITQSIVIIGLIVFQRKRSAAV